MDGTIDLISDQTPGDTRLRMAPSGPVRGSPTAIVQLQLARLAALTELIARIQTAGHVRAACQILADEVQGYISVPSAPKRERGNLDEVRVFVGHCRDGSLACRLRAISGVSGFHPRDERALAAQAVLQESVARGELACWPPADASRSAGILAHRQFASASGVAAIVSAPLRDPSGQLRGAWMVAGDRDRVLCDHVVNFLQAAAAPVASSLSLVARAQKGRLHQGLREVGRMMREKKGRALLAAVAVLAVILAIPVRYHPRCDCVVEPVTRRYVAAPFDGPLEKALVQPGDLVQAGQLLARMDGREIRWELAGTRADLHRAAKELAGHLANHASGRAEVARYEVDRLQMRTELLEHRDQNLEIRSPITGVVVSGDLKDAEGMPLEVGQTLFEISPLDEMVVEVSIAEYDFAYIRPGMPIRIRLDAFPFRRFDASIERVHPRAELRENKNVFIAEVRLERSVSGLRPGMRGTARVDADRYPLGWNLLRRPITAALTSLGW